MKKLSEIIILAALLSAFVLSTTAFATIYSYDDTLPTFGHKTLAEGIRETSTTRWAINMPGNCESAFYCWIDYKHPTTNEWVLCTDTHTCYANDIYYLEYSPAVPAEGVTVRLRTKAFSTLGGQRIVGQVNFQ